MDILIRTIPHKEQRYETCGDYFVKDGVLNICVSKLSDEKREDLIKLHELIEKTLCKHRGITDESIDAFDMAYEAKRPEGDFSEPGDCPEAPYVKEHCFATGIERLMAAELGVNWVDYEKELESLP